VKSVARWRNLNVGWRQIGGDIIVYVFEYLTVCKAVVDVYADDARFCGEYEADAVNYENLSLPSNASSSVPHVLGSAGWL